MSVLSLASLNVYELVGGLAGVIVLSGLLGGWIGSHTGVSAAYRRQARQHRRR
jgi:hypothetical protein